MLNRAGDAFVRIRGARTGHGRWLSAALTAVAVLGASAGALGACLTLLPAAMVLPVMGVGLLLAAGTLALLALAAPAETGAARLLFWDVAGALTLIGLCAAAAGESEPVLAYLTRER